MSLSALRYSTSTRVPVLEYCSTRVLENSTTTVLEYSSTIIEYSSTQGTQVPGTQVLECLGTVLENSSTRVIEYPSSRASAKVSNDKSVLRSFYIRVNFHSNNKLNWFGTSLEQQSFLALCAISLTLYGLLYYNIILFDRAHVQGRHHNTHVCVYCIRKIDLKPV